jgi:CheY-like chemotaxis protein
MVLKWLEKDPGVSDLVVLVIQSLPKRYKEMRQALDANEVEVFMGLVHSLKGTAASFHMDELYQLALNMDRDLKKRRVMDDRVFIFMDRLYELIENIPEDYYEMEVLEESLDGQSFGPYRVLVADPSEEECQIIRQMLLGQPIEVVMTTSGFELVNKLSLEGYDILIINIQAPAMKGQVALDYLSAHGRGQETYTISIGTEISEQEMEHYRRLGVGKHIAKPINKRLMRHTILERIKMSDSIKS